MALYAWIQPGRAGLGNQLLPWARAVIFAHQHNARMLRVQWTQLRIGPILRGDADKRFHIGLFSSRGYVSGPRKWALLALAPRWSELDAPGVAQALTRRRAIVVFQGMHGVFDPLIPHRELISRHLHDMLAPRLRQLLDADPRRDFFAMHVRRGDTATLKYGEPYPVIPGHFALPIEWFVKIAHQLRERSGGNVPLLIFSDGTDAQLQPLLSLPGVELVRGNPSIIDILLMSRARLLVPSSTSTFSMWSAFLGRMPTIWYHGKTRNLTDDQQSVLESDLQGNLPPFPAV